MASRVDISQFRRIRGAGGPRRLPAWNARLLLHCEERCSHRLLGKLDDRLGEPRPARGPATHDHALVPVRHGITRDGEGHPRRCRRRCTARAAMPTGWAPSRVRAGCASGIPLPARPRMGSSRSRSPRSSPGAMKPVKRSPSNREYIGPRWLPRTTIRQPFSAVMSSSMSSAVTTVVVRMRRIGEILVIAHLGMGAGQLQVDLAVMVLHVGADERGDHVGHRRITHDLHVGVVDLARVVDPPERGSLRRVCSGARSNRARPSAVGSPNGASVKRGSLRPTRRGPRASRRAVLRPPRSRRRESRCVGIRRPALSRSCSGSSMTVGDRGSGHPLDRAFRATAPRHEPPAVSHLQPPSRSRSMPPH